MTKFEEELSVLLVSKSTNYAEYWNKAQLLTVFKDWQPQQALPVVPECVAKWYEEHKNDLESSIYRLCIEFNQKVVNTLKTKTKLENWLDYTENKPIETLIRMQDGYTVEKPQLFKIIFPNSTAVLQKDGELNSFADTVYKRYLNENAMTEQEIKSIDERYWKFAVPVEDGK